MARPLRLKEMTPAQAAEAFKTTSRLLVPAGTVEARGPHLPLGCDTVILERLADDLSASTGIPRAPALEYGVHATKDDPVPGTAALSRKTLHRAMNELIALWEEVGGVRDTLILTAHAADQHRVTDILALDSLPPLLESRFGPWHGGEVDTSLMLYLAPELVDLTLTPPTLLASAEKGARFYQAILTTLTQHLSTVELS